VLLTKPRRRVLLGFVMPAINTRKLTSEEAVAFKVHLTKAVKHFGLRKAKDLAAYVQPFVPVKFNRYTTNSALSRDRVMRIMFTLDTWMKLPEKVLPTPASAHRVYQSVQLLLLTKPSTHSAWMGHVDAFVRHALLQVPGTHVSTWKEMAGANPSLEWQIKNANKHLRVVVYFDRSDASACVAAMRAGDVKWRIAVVGSWCHETWLRVVDYVWREMQVVDVQQPSEDIPDFLRQVTTAEHKIMNRS